MADNAYEAAVVHYRAGRMADAQAILRQILAQQPDYAEAMVLLATIAHRTQQPREAVALLRRAVELNPRESAWQLNLGNALQAVGSLNEAVAAYRAALQLQPDWPEAHYNLGNSLKNSSLLEEAIASFQKALSLRPDFAEAQFNLANALKAAGRVDEAIESYRKTIALRPTHGGALNNLATALRDAGLADAAMDAGRRAIAVRPDLAEAHNNLGNLLLDRGEGKAAIESFHRALQLRPDSVEALNNLGNAHRALGEWEAAEAAYRSALSVQPESAQTRWNLSMIQLLRGNLAEGFANYESRLKLPGASVRRDFSQSLWDGSRLEGKTILLHAEQGMGDAIQFVRYVPFVRERGGRVRVLCHEPLRRLFTGQLGIDRVVGFDEPLPPFEVHCPLMSLPRVFGTTLHSIPAQVPYLASDAQLTQQWRHRLSQLAPRQNIGLVWAGNPAHEKDRQRSIDLSAFAPLAAARGVRFISLQKGPAAAQANFPPEGMELRDWSAELGDFADTAALIATLDAVLCVDTAVAHLAGALGKPVWLLVPIAPDWRWLLHRADSPWYPTMRLVRQTRTGQWADAIEMIASELE